MYFGFIVVGEALSNYPAVALSSFWQNRTRRCTEGIFAQNIMKWLICGFCFDFVRKLISVKRFHKEKNFLKIIWVSISGVQHVVLLSSTPVMLDGPWMHQDGLNIHVILNCQLIVNMNMQFKIWPRLSTVKQIWYLKHSLTSTKQSLKLRWKFLSKISCKLVIYKMYQLWSTWDQQSWKDWLDSELILSLRQWP